LKAIDLFCGGGGASEGLRQAGIDVVLAVDLDKSALATHMANHPDTEHLLADVTTLLRDDYSWPKADVLWASPPCQQFSTANSAKGDPEIGMVLVDAALDVVERARPSRGWCMENVPPVRDYLPMHRVPKARILNAADYGVPQRRRRCYYGRYTVPTPTHQERGHGQQQSLFGGADMLPWVTVREALGPLLLEPHPEEEWTDDQLKRIVAGKRDPSSLYHGSWATAGKMEFPDSLDKPARTILTSAVAPGREAFVIHTNRDQRPDGSRQTAGVDEPALTYTATSSSQWKISRSGGEDHRRYGTDEPCLTLSHNPPKISMEDGLNPGRQYPVDGVAPTLRAQGTRPTVSLTFGIGDLRGPNYQPRAWDPDQPAPTILDPHHDRLTTEVDGQIYRRLTTLEASLLQGFPPTYQWLGTKTAQHRQIGNAVVPPIVRAIVLATTVMERM